MKIYVFKKRNKAKQKHEGKKGNFIRRESNPRPFSEKRNISFQNDISLKTMRLGVLSTFI